LLTIEPDGACSEMPPPLLRSPCSPVGPLLERDFASPPIKVSELSPPLNAMSRCSVPVCAGRLVPDSFPLDLGNPFTNGLVPLPDQAREHLPTSHNNLFFSCVFFSFLLLLRDWRRTALSSRTIVVGILFGWYLMSFFYCPLPPPDQSKLSGFRSLDSLSPRTFPLSQPHLKMSGKIL